jgi:hypothetical protein
MNVKISLSFIQTGWIVAKCERVLAIAMDSMYTLRSAPES